MESLDNDVATMTVEGLVDLLKEKKSFILSQDVARYIRFVGFDKGILSVNLEEGYPREIIKNINHFFEENKYKIKMEYSNEKGEDTLEQKKKAVFKKQLEEVSQNPILKEILECFSNSVVANIEEL
ncbi:MAG: hypothetical protein IJ638_03985 [Alphaproteobacteria bacterium]|nr:hypothetical protein [Alphaproteobacteria bacterium]